MSQAHSLPDILHRASSLMERLEQLLPHPLREPHAGQHMAFRYQRMGMAARLEPLPRVGAMALDHLQSIDDQKQRLVQNTRQFVQGHPANHVLLTGSRGTGKSSLVRACLHAFAPQGLRLIEVDKSDLIHLHDIAQSVAHRPEKFLVFCDDLSFESGETSYKALKSMLDGTVAPCPDNIRIYATSNRRHLLPEHMKDNLDARYTEAGELHPAEGVEEKISLSERFGLWISFYPFSQEDYLRIVRQYLQVLGLEPHEAQAAQPEALLFALQRGSRSGRVAQQFALDFVGRLRCAASPP
jgi:predicted AAA+ superfamily ATPase